MKKTIQALNNYFFDEDTITVSDGLWFYGIIGALIIAIITTWVFIIL